jgi:mannose-6-phosphate isomerase-like protein (cupin superfamily)
MTAPDFIFMLTRADTTVPEAASLVEVALAAGVRHIGFKDVGLPPADLAALTHAIRAGGATVYLEVVSLDAESERRSAAMAVSLGVDVLMGGTRPEIVVPEIAGRALRYLPFAGAVSGHPSVLGGTIETIAARAAALAAQPEVDGIDLLAYRFAGDVSALIAAVRGAIGTKRLIVAGSIDGRERLALVAASGADGFTIGTAAIDGALPAASTLAAQLGWVMALIEEGNEMMDKVNLGERFASFADHWSPKIVGDVNDAQVKLAKFTGQFHWHHHDHEDELFLVVAGRLRMGFRDRDVDLDPGEFIIVPRGTEHRPEALDGECHVLLLEPNTTLNTGNVMNERTVVELERIAG